MTNFFLCVCMLEPGQISSSLPLPAPDATSPVISVGMSLSWLLILCLNHFRAKFQITRDSPSAPKSIGVIQSSILMVLLFLALSCQREAQRMLMLSIMPSASSLMLMISYGTPPIGNGLSFQRWLSPVPLSSLHLNNSVIYILKIIYLSEEQSDTERERESKEESKCYLLSFDSLSCPKPGARTSI